MHTVEFKEMCEVLKVVCVGVVRKEELKGAGRGTEANVDRGCTEFGTGTRYRGPGSQTCRRQEETKQRGTEADRNRNAHGNRLHSEQLGPTADRKREGARREGLTAGPGERGGAARPGWGRGLWDEANDGKGGLESVANGRASRIGAWPLVGSQWQGIIPFRGKREYLIVAPKPLPKDSLLTGRRPPMRPSTYPTGLLSSTGDIWGLLSVEEGRFLRAGQDRSDQSFACTFGSRSLS